MTTAHTGPQGHRNQEPHSQVVNFLCCCLKEHYETQWKAYSCYLGGVNRAQTYTRDAKTKSRGILFDIPCVATVFNAASLQMDNLD